MTHYETSPAVSVPEYRGPKGSTKSFLLAAYVEAARFWGRCLFFVWGTPGPREEKNRTQHFDGSHSVGQHGTDVFSSGVVADLSDLFSEFASRLFGRAETSHRKVAAKAKRLSARYVDCIKLVIRFAGQFM